LAGKGRLTQRDIARLAGVSQATVSLVLNDAKAAAGRIPAETRERVHKAIRDTGYVADPIARRMAKGLNRILGVFTYEPAFPSAQADFFVPFLLGIEERAQALGYDLLLLTGASGPRGQRKIFHENNRLRLADGCVLLGREFDRAELRTRRALLGPDAGPAGQPPAALSGRGLCRGHRRSGAPRPRQGPCAAGLYRSRNRRRILGRSLEGLRFGSRRRAPRLPAHRGRRRCPRHAVGHP